MAFFINLPEQNQRLKRRLYLFVSYSAESFYQQID